MQKGAMTLQLALPLIDQSPRVGATPFVKWAGGKSRLLAQLMPMLPVDISACRYFEPFVGGGALFFAQRPAKAVLSDANAHLCTTYEAVRDEVDAVIEKLRELAAAHSTERYYAMRARYNQDSLDQLERAALFIYLNKTCFNGLHRVNKRGEFNVPAGRYERPRILDEQGLRVASRQLQRAQMRCAGFEAVLEHARAGDFIYFDPPYVPVSRTSSFTGYAAEGFSSQDQQRLRDVFGELDRRGCALLLSNSATAEVRALYHGYVINEVGARRSISCGKRGAVTEIVVRNYGRQAPRASAYCPQQLEAFA
jgi:DNA adenine methylase